MHLRISTLDAEPFAMYEPGSNVWRGLAFDILHELRKHVNFTYSITSVNHYFGGQDLSGEWVGIIGDLVKNVSDMGVQALNASPERTEVTTSLKKKTLQK